MVFFDLVKVTLFCFVFIMLPNCGPAMTA